MFIKDAEESKVWGGQHKIVIPYENSWNSWKLAKKRAEHIYYLRGIRILE